MGFNLLVIVFVVIFVLLLAFRPRTDAVHPVRTEPGVIEAFRKARRRQWVMSIPLATVVIYLQWHRGHSSSATGVDDILSLIAVAVAVLFTYRNWRCPECGAYLGKYPLYRGVCPKCGTALREQEK